MKRNIACAAVFVFIGIALAACGGDGSTNPTNPQHAPAISNLRYSPSSASLGQGGGSITATGNIDFVDLDGNVATVTITLYDSVGNPLGTATGPVSGASGVTSGTIAIAVIVSTATSGNYTFTVHITDGTGLESNKLTGSFSVV